MSAFFQGPTGFIIIAAVLFLIGLGFVVVLTGLNGHATPMPVTQVFYGTYFFWLILLLIAPIITMRSFAMERASGTYESLMTAPVGDWEVVLSKFTGALVFYGSFGFPYWYARWLSGCTSANRQCSGLARCSPRRSVFYSSGVCTCRWAASPRHSRATRPWQR
ncbi:MAG: hypothetical protein CM1200mP29_08650 [Verrucomicrobiota bacterium]|nr:MAG: hypothetical protein CM1200mP29_08650 [Verrucomicrobiota bacterium]